MVLLPIVDRELRVAARRPSTYWMRCGAALLVLIVFMVLLSNGRGSMAQMGKNLLNAMGILALGFSMMSGVFLTSDCLSEEKREGTLGLLFLTDLKGYDVVFGKLVANSLHAFFGLLAVFPVLGLSLLLGGVTGAEFGRLILVFTITLFLSLSLGMVVSATSSEAKQAMMTAFFLMVLMAGVFPALWWLQWVAFKSQSFDFLLWPSPAYAYLKAFDSHYRIGMGTQAFWMCVGTLFGFGLFCLVIANVVLPRMWHRAGSVGNGGWFGRIRKTEKRGGVKEVMVEGRPIYWLLMRDAGPRRAAGRVFLLMLPIILISGVASIITSQYRVTFVVCLFASYALHVVVKVLMMVEASRRLNEDRRSGALELLLATPMSVKAIVGEQAEAIRRQFRGPLLLLALVNVGLCFTITVFSGHLHMSGDDLMVFFSMFVGGLLLLFLDFRAIAWVGMWHGLKATKHHQAVLRSMGQIMLIPWVIIFFLVFLERGFRSAGGAAMTVMIWVFVGAIVGGLSAKMARDNLECRFRSLVAGQKN